MHSIRTRLATDRRHSGQRVSFDAPPMAVALAASRPVSSATDDLRLFAATFGAGFLFVTIFFA